MTTSLPLSVFAVSLALAALSALPGPVKAQAKIECGSILGPGGSYVLDRNLTCPRMDKNAEYQERTGVLKVIERFEASSI